MGPGPIGSTPALGPFGAALVPFSASLSGTYDPQTLEILGQVTITNEAGEVCRGPFQAGALP